MDGNSTFTISVFFMIVGGLGGIYGIIAKRDSKKVQEGKAQGILETTLKSMNETLDAFKKSNDLFQKEHREEHQKLDERMKEVEKFVVKHEAVKDAAKKKTKSDIEE